MYYIYIYIIALIPENITSWTQHCHKSEVVLTGPDFAYYYLSILYYLNYHDKDGHLEAFTC